MNIINRRTATFSALALMLGVFLGGLIYGNLILIISIPLAMFAIGMLFLWRKSYYVFLFYLVIAVGISAYAVDRTLGEAKTEGDFSVLARVEKTGKGYYYADDIYFDGKGYRGKIKIYYGGELSVGDVVEFDGTVKALKFEMFDSDSRNLYCDRVYYETKVSDVAKVGDRKKFTEKVKDRMIAPMYKFMDYRDAGIVKSLLFGDKSDMAARDKEIFADVGLSHVFALSGMHVGFLVGLVLLIAEKTKLNKKSSIIFCAAALVFYGILTGFPSGLKRAAIMTLCVLAAPLCRAKNDPLNTLGLACFIIVLTNPREMFDLSFIMSAGSVLGIILFHRPLARLISGKRKGFVMYLSEGVAFTLSANIFLFPIVAGTFNTVALYSVFSNLVVLPIVEVAYILIAISATLSLIFSGFGVLYYLVQFPIIAIRIISSFVYSLPYASLSVSGLGIGALFYVAAFFVMSRFVKTDAKKKTVAVCSLSVIGSLLFIFL